MKTYKYLLVAFVLALGATSCEIEDGENLNGTTTDAISEDLSRGELNETMSGSFCRYENTACYPDRRSGSRW